MDDERRGYPGYNKAKDKEVQVAIEATYFVRDAPHELMNVLNRGKNKVESATKPICQATPRIT